MLNNSPNTQKTITELGGNDTAKFIDIKILVNALKLK